MNKIKNQKILVDSCILIYCGAKEHCDSFKKLLRLLSDNGNKLAISELCGFEVIKNCQNKANLKYYFKLIDYLDNIEINKDILIKAALLYNLYKKGKKTNQELNEFKKEPLAGDLIIGGTAIHHNALLLTSNLDDFPSPHWEPVARDYAIYDKNMKYKILNSYLLKFNGKLTSNQSL